MLNDIHIGQILFLDIETVASVYQYPELPETTRDLWADKTKFIQQRDGISAEEAYHKAGIYAEFGKVVCISTAIVQQKDGAHYLRVKSFCGHEEGKVLSEFADILRKYYSRDDRYLCGHNLKEFDIPFMARRMVVHGIELPQPLNLAGRKPWEVRHLDTMELWKFGDHKHYTSLSLLTHLLGIPTPKEDISGADVGRVYWEEDDLDRIKVYCEKDTIAVAQVMMKFKNLPNIPSDHVEYL